MPSSPSLGTLIAALTTADPATRHSTATVMERAPRPAPPTAHPAATAAAVAVARVDTPVDTGVGTVGTPPQVQKATTPAEFLPTREYAEWTPRPGVRYCRAVRTCGLACRAYLLKPDQDCCPAHDPDRAAAHRAGASRGGKRAGAARHAEKLARKKRSLHGTLESVRLADRPSIQALLSTLFRLELTGEIDPHRARSLTRILSLALRHAPEHGAHFDDASFAVERAIVLDIAPALHNAEIWDHTRHLEALANQNARLLTLETTKLHFETERQAIRRSPLRLA